MRCAPALAALGLLLAAPAAAADAYQRVIDRVARGYEILGRDDMLQDEDVLRKFMDADELAKRKRNRRPALVSGRFDGDGIPDFAALVVNRGIRGEGPDLAGQLAVRLVVCLGAGGPGGYRCEILPTLYGNFARLPYGADLARVAVKGRIRCASGGATTRAYHPEGSNAARPGPLERDVPALVLRPGHDAIGEYAIGSNLGRTLVRRADGTYVDCANAD